MIEEYLDDDIQIDSERISEIYELSQRIKQGNEPSKDNVLEMYYELSDLGIVDKSFKDMNRNLTRVMKMDMGVLESPFIITKVSTFLYNQFEQMESKEEIAVNEIMLSNRLAKLADRFVKVARGEDNQIATNELGWDKEKLEVMSKLFIKYEEEYSKEKWDFISDIEFNDNGEIDVDRFESIERNENKEINNNEYDKFKIWYSDSLDELLKNESNLSKKDFSDIDIPKFQNYMRMKISQNTFYEEKYLGIKKASELKNGYDLRLYDATQYDSKPEQGKKLIRIELAGYVAPFFVHCKDEQKFYETVGKNIKDVLNPEPVEDYKYYPNWNYRMTDEQLKFALQKIPDHITYGNNMSKDVLSYMKESAVVKQKSDRRKERDKRIADYRENEEKNVPAKLEDNEQSLGKQFKLEEQSNMGENVENKRRKRSTRSDEEFLNEDIISVLEKNDVVQLPEKYKEKLSYKKDSISTKLERVYDSIEEYLGQKLQGEDEEKVKLESVKMFTYMKIAERSFWSGVNGKTGDGKKQTREDLYDKIYADCDKGIGVIKDAISENVNPFEIKMYARKKLKTEDIKGVNKSTTKMTRKKDSVEKKMSEPKEEKKEEVNNNNTVNHPEIKEADNNNNSFDLESELEKQEKRNEKISDILKNKSKSILLKEELLEKKKECVSLLQQLKENQDRIRVIESELSETDETINTLENDIFKDRGEK